MKTLVIFFQAVILFVIGVILAFATGLVAGLAGAKWIEEKERNQTEDTEDPMHLVRPYNEQSSKNWSPESEVNLLFLRNTENYVNDLLRNRGHVFLNDVYDQLGMTRTSHGAIAGWLFTDNKRIAFVPRDLKPGDDIELEFDYDGVIYNRLVILD